MTLIDGDHSFVDTAKTKSICFVTLLNAGHLFHDIAKCRTSVS